MRIVEIFGSIEGEGIRSGKLATFIRTAGCNCRCSYCDTKYSFDVSDYPDMSIDDIMKKVEEIGNKLVTVTGGEPLIQKDMRELLSRLTLGGYKVNIETNGSVDIRPFQQVGNLNDFAISQDNIMFTVDWKSISSGMSDRMLDSNLFACRDKDVIKFVVGNKEDLDQMLEVITKNKFRCQNIYISPVWGDIEMTDIVQFMKDNNLQNCTLQVQLHKLIWPVNMRGV